MSIKRIQEEMQRITGIGSGFMQSRVLLTANRLGLFRAMGRETLGAAELARRVEADERAVGRILDVLCALGLLFKEGGAYRIKADQTQYLLPDGAHYIGDILGHYEHLWDRWSHLTEVAKSGRPVPPEAVPGFRESESARKDFILGMANIGAQGARELVRALDPRGPMKMLDVGGGPGTYALAFAEYNPELRATVFDLPEVVPIAEEQIRLRHLEDRVTTCAGSYPGTPLPGGNDLVLLSNIIHSLGPAENLEVLRGIYRALEPGGRLVLKDFLVDDDRTGPMFPVIFAINMLVGTPSGGTYTEEEIRHWLVEVGFRPGALIHIGLHSAAILGQK